MSKAIGQFIVSIENSREMAQKIQESLNGHLGKNPDKIVWGNVGDARHIESLLRQVVAAVEEIEKGTN